MKLSQSRTLLISVFLICLGSGTLHVLIFGKRHDLHYQHYEDRPRPIPTATDLSVEGRVSAIGMDCIHLQGPSNKVRKYRCESPGSYKLGQRLRIHYVEGKPPQALRIEDLSASGSEKQR
jgi:hypothetical protein